jgi:hypothetical protein
MIFGDSSRLNSCSARELFDPPEYSTLPRDAQDRIATATSGKQRMSVCDSRHEP